MKAIELIKILNKGLVDHEKSNVVTFDTENLSQRAKWFGHYFDWSGHLRKGDYFAIWQAYDEEPIIDDPDIIGVGPSTDVGQYFLYKID